MVLHVVASYTVFTAAGGGFDGLGRLERWTIDPAARRVLDPAAQEHPRIDERRFGEPYRDLYTVSVPVDGNTQFGGATQIYKHDLETGAHRSHGFGAGRVPGELIFVPARSGAGEDEGWLVGLIVDTARDATDFAVLDARTFEAPAIATIHLGHRTPPGFHGNWFPTAGSHEDAANA